MFDFGPDNYVDSRNASQFDEFISTLSGIVGVSVVSPVLPDIKQIIDKAYDYYNGNNVPKDYAEAANWYRKAADQGHAEAKDKLNSLKFKFLSLRNKILYCSIFKGRTFKIEVRPLKG